MLRVTEHLVVDSIATPHLARDVALHTGVVMDWARKILPGRQLRESFNAFDSVSIAPMPAAIAGASQCGLLQYLYQRNILLNGLIYCA